MKLLFIFMALLLTACNKPIENSQSQRLSPAEMLGSEDVEGFLRAEGARDFSFPEDHGPHVGFRNEWWYLTGNLETESGRRFGYQVTFFSTAIRAGSDAGCETDMSPWCTNAIWMGHAAISDIGESRHYAAERFTRQEPGLAGAKLHPFKVWLQDWQIISASNELPWELEIFADAFALTLRLDSTKKPVLQGVSGLSQKSAEAGNASYYYSLTDLVSSGEIFLGGQSFSVKGSSWLDREWGTSALAGDQSGWDWFSLQFEDERQLMYYQLRDQQGNAHPNSSGNMTSLMGTQTLISTDEMQLESLQTWRAPDGTDYTTQWRMQYAGNDWIIKAAFEDQLMDVTFQYWEGAVDVVDNASGQIIGKGYLEMVR